MYFCMENLLTSIVLATVAKNNICTLRGSIFLSRFVSGLFNLCSGEIPYFLISIVLADPEGFQECYSPKAYRLLLLGKTAIFR